MKFNIVDGVLLSVEEADASIRIPQDVKEIGPFAFKGCQNLKEIILPNNLKKIACFTFADCNNLTRILLPNDVEIIEEYAFHNCTSLEKIDLPTNLKEIGENAFFGCTNLKIIDFPCSLEVIESYAFYNCIRLSSVTFPDSLKVIGSSAFSNCSNLTTIKIPNGLKKIADGLFEECSNLIEVILPTNLEEIEDSAFARCTGITTINLPHSLKRIGAEAFWNCQHLITIDLPEKLEEIEEGAFSECTSLSKINLPNKIKTIRRSSFQGCTNLKSVRFSFHLKKIEDEAFSECSNLEIVNFPNGLEEIGDLAFHACSKLTKITFPNRLNVIGNRAFSDCFCLEEVLFPSSIKYIGTLAFANCKDIKMKRLNNTKPCENKENSNKTEIGLNLEEVGIWISCFVLLSKDDEPILKYENSTIVFNYKLFYSEQDLYSLIRTILTSEQDALKILFFSIKLFVLYGTLEELDKMLCILGSLVFGPSSPSKKELEETRELAYRCRYFIYGKEDKHIQFEQIAKTYCYDYDYSALDKLLISNFQTMNCFFCGKPSLVINKERNIYICFHCNKYGRVTDLDIVKKTQRKEKLKYYDEIYNELKKEHYIKTKKYALYGIKFYKLNMYFIDPILYEDEDVLYELIKNKAFTNNYMQLKILNDYRFQERILELDENNDIYIKNNILLDDDFAEEASETYSNNDSKLDIPNSDFYKNFDDEILLSDDEILF